MTAPPDGADGVEVVSASDPATVDRVADALRGGGVVVLPTDTVYGLAAAADRPEAVQRLFALKGRAATVPVAVLCADTDQALGLAGHAGTPASRLASRHWPGPLTLVLPRRAGLGWELGEPRETIGLRCPDHELVRAVAGRIGPLATTSANRHGEATPTEARAAAASLTGPVDLIVDGGRVTGVASTVVDLASSPAKVLRVGALDVDLDDSPR